MCYLAIEAGKKERHRLGSYVSKLKFRAYNLTKYEYFSYLLLCYKAPPNLWAQNQKGRRE